MDPWPPPDRPELRTHRFREVGDSVERWVWERNATQWRLAGISSRAEVAVRVANMITRQREITPVTPEELEWARKLTEEHGW